MRFLCALACLAASFAACALPANVELVETYRGIAQYRLKSNGMTILLQQDRTSPVFTFMVVYHVGSRNEAPGNTGSAHLLEHMIFNKSTENFGRAKGHKTFQEVLYESGADAGSSNMTTWYDRMNGYSTLPSDKLETAMRIEADRLGRALILDSERASEMSVVRNEFEIGENNPFQALLKATVAAAVVAHPYHWSTIGYRSDIEGVTTEKLREHYKAYFHPDNADAILVGDFDVEKALALFDREFGGFPKAANPIPKVITVEPPQEGERRALVKRPGTLGLTMVGYIRPGASHPDFIALEVLSNILGDGVNSRLHQALVEKGLATNVSSFNFTLKDPYPLLLFVTNAPGKTHQDVENAVKAAVAEVLDKGVTDEEVKRAQQQIEVSVVRSRDGTYNFASNLGESVASTDWKWFLDYVDRIKAVTPADVKRVAQAYLVPDHATVGWFIPSPPAKASTPMAQATLAAPAVAAARDASAPKSVAATTSKPFAQRTLRKVLPNGVIVDVMENRAVPTVAVRGLVFAGDATAPPGEPALPALVAKMMSRGTTSRTKEEIGARLDDVGATRAYATTLNQVAITASGMARDLPLLLDILADEYRHPAFRADEIDKARRELENDYKRNDDNTSLRAMERLSQLVYAKDHPYYPPEVSARLASVGAVTEAQLREFHRDRYNGASLVIAIVGDIDAAKAIALVEKNFGAMPRGERASLARVARREASGAGVREAVTMRGKANMNIVIGAASGLRRGDPDYEAAIVANAALGQTALSSRLGRRVRDTEGLTYQIYSRFLGSDELDGVWLANVNVAPQNLEKALKSTREVIAQFAREGASDAEVEAQKSFFAGNFQVNLGSNAGIAEALASAEKFGFGPKYLDEYPARIRAVTTAQANAAMRKHFFAERLNLVVAGDLDKAPE
ncbi:MAG TPA: pitrilysin family protein [Usitatibacter sp.]|nr:pitrilysin family protein [Usitatibacter sp.]